MFCLSDRSGFRTGAIVAQHRTFEGRVTLEGKKVTVEGTYKNIGGDGEFRGVTGNSKFKTVLKSDGEIDCSWEGKYVLAKAHAR